MLHNKKDTFEQLVLRTSEYLGVKAEIVEKDYFVTLFLKRIAAVMPDIVFKGGTSLSKCYHTDSLIGILENELVEVLVVQRSSGAIEIDVEVYRPRYIGVGIIQPSSGDVLARYRVIVNPLIVVCRAAAVFASVVSVYRALSGDGIGCGSGCVGKAGQTLTFLECESVDPLIEPSVNYLCRIGLETGAGADVYLSE